MVIPRVLASTPESTLRGTSLSLALLLAFGCGSSRPDAQRAGEAEETPEVTARPGSDTANADSVPMPELPDTATAAEERTPPTITDIASASAALREGFYAQVGASFASLGDSPEAKILRVRFLLETGEYDEAATLAETLAGDQRTLGQTLKGEALLQRGRLDDAEATLTPLSSVADAHRAHMLLGRLHLRRGRRVEARSVFMLLIDAYNDDRITRRDAEGLAYVGIAARSLGAVRDANNAFGESLRADAGRFETRLESARLFLQKYDAGHAEEHVRDVLAVNPELPEALALMARIRIDQSFNFAAAEELTARALQGNPNLVMAHVNLAGMALRDLDIGAADAHLDRALAIDPNDLEALSTRAAVRYLADDESGFRQAKAEVFSRHRTYSEFYGIVGEYAEWEHRYPDIVEMSREAITLNSNDETAHAMLGLNLLRMGDEEAGVRALQDAWSRDRFNVRVFNTLNLYDDVIPDLYEEVEATPFIFRFSEQERPMLERYIPRTLQGAYRDMVSRYGFTPEGPVRVELYSDLGHFSVRTTGLPNLGVQGVCFGKVITAISPAGGPFNWGQIDWHELAHVFHIQLSQNHVPRWFTEGLAEYETLIARPEWKREMDHYLWAALERDELPPLRLMNRAFTRARSALGMMTAYYASTRIVKYIADEHGFAKVVQMLRDWGAGRRTPEVVQRALGMTLEELDEAFRSHARRRLQARRDDFSVDFEQYTDLAAAEAAASAAPNNATKKAAFAAALLVSGDAERAQAMAEAAIALEANQPVARFLLARLALGSRDGAAAEQHLRAIIAGGRDGYEIRLLLARAALGRDDAQAAKTELQAAAGIDPERSEAWQGLVRVADGLGDEALKYEALGRLVRIDEHDRTSHSLLLTHLVESQSWDEALEIGEMVPFIDPHNAQSHRLLAQVYLAFDRFDDALYEADSAIIGGHEAPAEVQILRARALKGLRRVQEARAAVEAAIAADPAVADRANSVL